jgi:[protein-PII] uridylyltransferase
MPNESSEPVYLEAPFPGVQEMYRAESESIRRRFEESQNGTEAIRARSDLVDHVITQLWSLSVSSDAENLCVVALGGYGRKVQFPHSDVDLLFLSWNASQEREHSLAVRSLCQSLWDLHLRVSPTTRNVAECGKLYHDNLEFNISLLDCRYVCGNRKLFEHLHTVIIPNMVAREGSELQQRLSDLTRARHKKYGHTIFHLEPNIKEYPGGMRDYQAAGWLRVIAELEKTGLWPAPDNLLPGSLSQGCSAAIRFLSDVRCFLHYHQGRDLNGLTYELQSEAAAIGIGIKGAAPMTAAEWMRTYFQHVRSIYRLTVLFDEVPPARSGLSRFFEIRKSRLSTPELTVVDDRIFLRQPSSVERADVLFDLFEFVARHGLKLSEETERSVEAALPKIRAWASESPDCWNSLRRILVLPHAGDAVRAMHQFGLVVLLFSEFGAIDSLVIRDYYHRYTVDEHSFVAIENVHALLKPDNELDCRFQDIVEGIERLDLLCLSLLFHDLGKGMPGESHVEGSLQALGTILRRLRLEPADRDVVTFLIASHLQMSATVMRRDIFDPATVAEFCEFVGTAERLKMLTIFTYADTKAVNPEALTPWKAEMLWQLYAAASNHLSRTLDEQRLHVDSSNDGYTRQVVSLASADLDAARITSFLEGFPKRYLLTHTPSQIVVHCRMHAKIVEDTPQIEIVKRGGYFELLLITRDRPYLFTKIAGTLSYWGMNILKAEAFSNQAGVVLDVFRFSDRFRTLDLNPMETTRLQQSLADTISGQIDVTDLMQTKFKPPVKQPKVKVEPVVRIDDEGSMHSTQVEIIAQDRPGLLYDVSHVLSDHRCNIEIAIIDTQGQTAIDVFYITQQGSKLAADQWAPLREAILTQL